MRSGPDGYCECRGDACGAGVCALRPLGCTRELAPVCGCDGETYGNDCLRRAAGTCFLHEGECNPGPDACETNRDCPADEQFCECRGLACGAGLCADRPQVCPRIVDPVCGCDGETYINDCERQHVGVCLLHEGECEVTDCRSNEACGRGNFCEFNPGTCAQLERIGQCQETPEACLDRFEPVCGCDGTTYRNDCHRKQAGVPLDHTGACDDGDACTDNGQCGRARYCEFAAGTCDQREREGFCDIRPLACPDVLAPVCGCDGRTYGNDCERMQSGVALDHRGECVTICGGFLGLQCPDGYYCDQDPGFCRGADITGTCIRPEDCSREGQECGCDGRTYESECHRIRAEVNKDHDGPCRR